jgi:transcriptional regulator with XRE-family HTH domain
MPTSALGAYLRERRARLDPIALGYPLGRRRTPGLRREEVAHRANISATWYSWLEQGRGGAPSADVLDRIARALMLTEVEREHLYLIALGRPPEVRYRPPGGVTARLQRVLDSLTGCPALLRTVSWDVAAWNDAARVMLTDYAALPPGERNVLRRLFLEPEARERNLDWEGVTRFVVGAFRADVARAGAGPALEPFIQELRCRSPEFAALWDDGEVRDFGAGVKRLRHAVLGEISIEHSAFAVDGRPDLTLLIYTPTSDQDARRIQDLAGALR